MTTDIDFSAVILAHVNWKKRFVAHVDGQDQLDPAVVRKDNACELGKWIEANLQLAKIPAYAELKDHHARFHLAAAAALDRSASMSAHDAKRLVEQSTDYGRASSDCISAIAALRDALKHL